MKTLSDIVERSEGIFKITGPKTKDDWRRLIEPKVDAIMKLSDMFSLPLLGNMEWMFTEYIGRQSLKAVPWKNRPTDATFKTQGAFWLDGRATWSVHIGSKGTLKFFGVTREKDWVEGTIRYLKAYRGANPVTGWSLQPISLKMRKTTINRILTPHPEYTWGELNRLIQNWHANAEKRLTAIEPLYVANKYESDLIILSEK